MPHSTQTVAASMHLREMDPALLTIAIDDALDALNTETTAMRTAMRVAALAHVGQRRAGHQDYPVDPYVIHPFRNVLRLMRYGCTDLDVLAATALHDTVEDQPEQIVDLLGGPDAVSALAEHFGSGVADIVAAVSNPPRPDGLSPEDKRLAYAEHVESVIAADPRVFLVKVSDFIDNAGSLRYLADEAKRAKLSAKYAPIVTSFLTALDRHGDALGLSDQGFADLAARLERLRQALEG